MNEVGEKPAAEDQIHAEVSAGQAPDNAKFEAAKARTPQNVKQKRKKRVKRIVTIAVVAVVLCGIAFGLYMLFKPKKSDKKLLTDSVTRGSIQSTVAGSGLTKAKNSASITLTSTGTVLGVFVKEGDTVAEGQELYTIDSTDAMESVNSAQKTVDNYKKQLQAIQDSYQYLTVRADFGGTLIDAADIKQGDDIATGKKLAQLVDDSQMKLELYFSYSYKDNVRPGQTADVSVPSTMSRLTGTVTTVDYVNKITSEGSKLFRAVITVGNPGVLTAGMGATAVLTDDAGNPVYPYGPGTFDYIRKTDIMTKTAGKASAVNLLNYAQVSAGDLLLKMDADKNDEQTATLENQLKSAEDALKKAQDNLKNFNAVSPISGTVISCALEPGKEIASGTVAISIADTSVMTIEAQVDEVNVAYVKQGMQASVVQYGRNGQEQFMGTVDSISLEGKVENGVSFFPAVITVDNPDGRLMSGMYVDYSLVASQSDNTLLVPVQSVKYIQDGACVFLKADEKPDNALDAAKLGLDVPQGFYAVPVKVGLSDNKSAEVISGLKEGDTVFTQYMTDNGNSMPGAMNGGVIIQGQG